MVALKPKIEKLDRFRGEIDFGIITMREDEFAAVLRKLPPKWMIIEGERQYNIAAITTEAGKLFYAAILRTSEQGHSAAQSAATHLLTELDPSCLVLVGIAGAKPESEFTLGDVVTATHLRDFSVTAALAGGKTEIASGGGPAHALIQIALANLGASHRYLGDWNSPRSIGLSLPPAELTDDKFHGDSDWNKKIRSTLIKRFTGKRLRRPLVTAATLGSGNVLVKDVALLRRWLSNARDLKAVEMELPGVFAAARSVKGDRPVLAIRGISDIVGFSRHIDWTAYACHTAASFTTAFLKAGVLNLQPKPKHDNPVSRPSPTRAINPPQDHKLKPARRSSGLGWVLSAPHATSGIAEVTLHKPSADASSETLTLNATIRVGIGEYNYANRSIQIGVRETFLSVHSSGYQIAQDRLVGTGRKHVNFRPAVGGVEIVGPRDLQGCLVGNPLGGDQLAVLESTGEGDEVVTVSLHTGRRSFEVFDDSNDSWTGSNTPRTNKDAILNALIAQGSEHDRQGRILLARARMRRGSR